MLWPQSTAIDLGQPGGHPPMPSNARLLAALCAAVVAMPLAGAVAQERGVAEAGGDFPILPLPPPVEGLIGLPKVYSGGRSTHLALITREAQQQGLPPAVADAVAQVESAYNPNAVGGVGEVGLMQILPSTAAMLGYRGPISGLFEPETNVRYSVAYLAGAWRLTGGDLCRTLMKYRAGHGEERMTPLSVEYCRRARGHLAAIGSPLADEAQPAKDGPETLVVAQQQTPQPASALVVARPLAGARQLAAALV